MTKYATMNPLGSSSPYDLFDNAQNFDFAINSINAAIWQDRLGRGRQTWYGIESMARNSMRNYGYITKKSFEQGFTLDTPNTVLQLESNGEYYRWDGDWSQPKVVPPGSTPESAGGVGPGKWVGVGDASLRSDLKKPSGAGEVGEVSGGTVQDKLDTLTSYSVTKRLDLFKYKIVKQLAAVPPLMAQIVAAEGYQYLFPQGFCYGKNGDIWINMSSDGGVATWATKYTANGDCVASFNAIVGTSETIHFYTDAGVDYLVVGAKGQLKFFDVTNLPAGSSVQTPVKTQTPDVNFAGCGFSKGRMLLEEQAPPLSTTINRDRWFVWNMDTAKREQAVTLPLQIAGAQGGTPYDQVLHKTQGIAATAEGLYLSHGKNASPTDTASQYATGVSLMNWQGDAEKTAMITPKSFADFLISKGLAPTRIENEGIAIGADGFPHVLQAYLTASNPGATTGGIVICSVGDPVGSDDLSHGAVAPLTATYYGKSAGNVLANPYTGDTMDTLAKIFDFMLATNREEYHFYTSSPVTDLDGTAFPASSMVRIYNPNNFTFFYEVINTKTRTLWYSLIPYSKNYASWSGIGIAGDLTNCITGDASGKALTGGGNSLYGHLSGAKLTTGSGNTNYGQGAGRGATTATGQTNVGRNAGWKQIDGTTDNNFDLTTCIGQDSRVSGANQVQLGGSGTTPYAYAALQIRSDARDKTEIREIDGDLAVAFVRGLVSCFYKLDLRDDYFEEYEEQTGVDENGQPVFETFRRAIPKDGSKKRNRDHAGYLTQQVKELMDRLGIDFGMYQDHLVNGGCDVQTLAYEQGLPFTTKAVDVAFERLDAQVDLITEQDKKIAAQEERLAKLEAQLLALGGQ